MESAASLPRKVRCAKNRNWVPSWLAGHANHCTTVLLAANPIFLHSDAALQHPVWSSGGLAVRVPSTPTTKPLTRVRILGVAIFSLVDSKRSENRDGYAVWAVKSS